WAAGALAAVTIGGAVLARRRPVGFAVALAVAAIAAGFATATIKRAVIAHPVLPAAAWNVAVTGFVEVREERERSDRIVVRVHHIEGPRVAEKPERLGVSVRGGTAPAVASFVEFRARLTPPLEPLMPGGYDFARAMYFQGIGASGFVLGAIRTPPPPAGKEGVLSLLFAAALVSLTGMRDQRIPSALPGAQSSNSFT